MLVLDNWSGCVCAARVPVGSFIAAWMDEVFTFVCGCVDAGFAVVCVSRCVSLSLSVSSFWTIGLGVWVCLRGARAGK